MQELEKILEEIEQASYMNIPNEKSIPIRVVKDIVCNRMNRNDGWIPVEDGMPEPYQQVLVSMYNNLTYVTIGSYDGGRWNVNEYITDLGVDVKAWRPLPQPYRSERSEGE